MSRLALPLAFLLAACGAVSVARDAAPEVPDACVPETDDVLCARLEACEAFERVDSCGATRTVDCGACSGGASAALGCVHGTCRAPECASLVFAGSAFPDIDADGLQDDVVAAAPGGGSFMHLRAQVMCGEPFDLFVTDEMPAASGTFVTTPVPAGQVPADLVVFWGSDAMTRDGLTLVATRVGNQAFATTTRSGLGATDFGAADDSMFAPLNASFAGTSLKITGPALTADGLELFYTVLADDTSVAGIYRSARAAESEPFGPGMRLPESAQGFDYVSGLSSDGLTLFMTRSFATTILTRASTSSPDFVNPLAPDAPPSVAGWQVTPLGDCAHLVGIFSPGGCGNEDVFRYDRQ